MKRILLISLLFLVVNSCKRYDVLLDQRYRWDSPTVAEAKARFEQSNYRIGFNEQHTRLEPLWENAFTDSNYLFVPIRFRNAFIKIEGNKNIPYEQLNFLSVQKDRESGDLAFMTVRISPDEWKTRDGRFVVNGKVTFSTLEGRIEKVMYVGPKGNRLPNKLASTGGGSGGGGGVECQDVVHYGWDVEVETVPCYGQGSGNHTNPGSCMCGTPGFDCHPPTVRYRLVLNITVQTYCSNVGGGDFGGPGNPGGGSYGSGGSSSGGGGTPYFPPDVLNPECVEPEGGYYSSHEEFLQCNGGFGDNIPVASFTIVDHLNIAFDLSEQELAFLNANEEIANGLYAYLTYTPSQTDNPDGPPEAGLPDGIMEDEFEILADRFEFGKWAISELSSGNITWEQFDNAYISGIAGEYDHEEAIIVTFGVANPQFSYHVPGLTTSFTEAEFDNVLANLGNDFNDDPIQFYLLACYKDSKLLNSSSYSIANNSSEVGEFLLTPHYNAQNTLVFYTAWRNAELGIEYIIRSDALQAFQNNYTIYRMAANALYVNGVPPLSQIQMAAGDYWEGLWNAHVDAITNPMYYVYLGHIMIGTATNLNNVPGTSPKIKFRSTTIRNTNKVSIAIDNYSSSQFRNLISQKYGANWEQIGTNRYRLVSGKDSYTSYPSTSSGQQVFDIEYFRGGKSIGVFRFKTN